MRQGDAAFDVALGRIALGAAFAGSHLTWPDASCQRQ